MSTDFFNILTMTIQLLAIIDPAGVIPLLVPIFEEGSKNKEIFRKIDRLVAIAVPTLLVIFTIIGDYLLKIFSIKGYDLKIAGGIILLIIAIDILREGFPKTSTINVEEYVFVPIITPMLVGPGAITAVLIFRSIYPLWQVLLSVLIASAITYLVIKFSRYLLLKIGGNMLRFIGRFMSIIIAAWAISLISEGILELWKVIK